MHHPELKDKPTCTCDHRLNGTGAVFLQSHGVLICGVCRGAQKIRKPI